MALKKIAVITYDVNNGLVYQRIHIAFRHLKDEFRFIFRDINDVRHSDMFYVDAVILVHPWTPDMMYLASRIRKHYGVPVITDLDDLLQCLPTDHPMYEQFRGAKVDQILMQTDYAVFSTQYLRKTLGHLTKFSSVIENSVNVYNYRAVRPANQLHKNCFIVGWTGAQSHRGDQYYTFLQGLERFLEERPDAKAYFHVLCPDRLLQRFGSQIIYEPVPADFLDYPGFAATYPFDVCMVGLTPCQFNEAKSDLKLLEMAPNKIPLLASPRSDFLQHKDKGIMLYAEDNSKEYNGWYEQLNFCYENRDELKILGQKAYDYVMTERTSEIVADKWRKVLNGVLEFHKKD